MNLKFYLNCFNEISFKNFFLNYIKKSNSFKMKIALTSIFLHDSKRRTISVLSFSTALYNAVLLIIFIFNFINTIEYEIISNK